MAGEYTLVSDVEPQLRLTLDTRDMGVLMASAQKDEPVNWSAVKEVYEKGRNSKRGDGSFRTLAGVAINPAVLAQFPNGAQVFGTPSFLDANVRPALEGTGRSRGLSDRARRQIVEKGVLAILYGETLEELEAARSKVQQGNVDNARGAPHNVDEAWAYYAGAQESDGSRPHALSITAQRRERGFKLEGKLDSPLQRALASALGAAQRSDLNALDTAIGQVRGYLNSIFYLASLGYASRLSGDTDVSVREVHLSEGWGFFQTIRPTVATASSDAAASVEALYTRPASRPVTDGDVHRVYGALNGANVVRALAIPSSLVVKAPPP